MSRATGLEIGVVVAVAVAAVGLVSGVESSGREVSSYVDHRPRPSTTVTGARSYRDMRAGVYGPNAQLPSEWWKTLRGGEPDLFAPVVQGPAERSDALAQRGARRAYEGAPPTVPHAVDQMGVPSCLSCHERGLTVSQRRAPVMSHERHDSCVQCHVVSVDPRPGVVTPPPPDNTFVGMGPPGPGERVWPEAPPTIPHPTWMRERCASCHGVRGWPGVRSTHPWRDSCTQCHAPSAALDQRGPVSLGAEP